MTTTIMRYPRETMLYDEEVLSMLVDEYENALSIKENVNTNAHIYEIRTAIEYWFGGRNDSHRFSDRIWQRCRAVDIGNLQLVGKELKYQEDVKV